MTWTTRWIAAAALTAAMIGAAGIRMAAQAPQRSLYDRLGGVYSIATVVDDFNVPSNRWSCAFIRETALIH